jgi:hypothetical protein
MSFPPLEGRGFTSLKILIMGESMTVEYESCEKYKVSYLNLLENDHLKGDEEDEKITFIFALRKQILEVESCPVPNLNINGIINMNIDSTPTKFVLCYDFFFQVDGFDKEGFPLKRISPTAITGQSPGKVVSVALKY